MSADRYVWFAWASAFLLPWGALYLAYPTHRRTMVWASLFTAPFGLTEPLFVPSYWNPPSLFDLAQRTGFDIESLIFCFGIGGVGAVLYSLVTRQYLLPLPLRERHRSLHRHHRLALAVPFITFPALYVLPWNPIYAGIVTMVIGAIATSICRPDLTRTTWVGGVLFVGYYAVFLAGLEITAPGYIARVWNLDALSGLLIAQVPVEELLFAFTFGAYWSSVYEHFTWRAGAPERSSAAGQPTGSRPYRR